MPTHTIQAIAARVGGRITGPAELAIHGVEQMDFVGPGQITFVGDAKYVRHWPECKASAALVDQKLALEPGPGRALIHVADLDLALTTLLGLFAPPLPRPAAGVHPAASIDPSATLGKYVAIGPGCFVGPRARLGDRVVLQANVSIMDEAVIGADTVLWPGVVVRDRCTIGARCLLHPNVVIGADGFGFRPAPDGKGLMKIPHIGIVRIGDDVEIGAGTCIDRGKYSATVIGDGTKLDNLCHIAHNVRVGRGCLLAGQIGIAGSTVLGDGVQIGGQAGLRDHITVGNGAQIGAATAVMNDVPAGAVYLGVPATEARTQLRQLAAIRKLPQLLAQLREARSSPDADAPGAAPPGQDT